MLDQGTYKGTKKEEELKKELESLKEEQRKLDLTQLEIDITYSAPPVEKINK